MDCILPGMEHAHLLNKCPLCQANYQEQEVCLVGERGPAKLFHCTCRACGQAMIAIVLESAGLMSSVGIVTDMEVRDALRCQSVEPITANECIQWHELFYAQGQALCQWLMAKTPSNHVS